MTQDPVGLHSRLAQGQEAGKDDEKKLPHARTVKRAIKEAHHEGDGPSCLHGALGRFFQTPGVSPHRYKNQPHEDKPDHACLDPPEQKLLMRVARWVGLIAAKADVLLPPTPHPMPHQGSLGQGLDGLVPIVQPVSL